MDRDDTLTEGTRKQHATDRIRAHVAHLIEADKQLHKHPNSATARREVVARCQRICAEVVAADVGADDPAHTVDLRSKAKHLLHVTDRAVAATSDPANADSTSILPPNQSSILIIRI